VVSIFFFFQKIGQFTLRFVARRTRLGKSSGKSYQTSYHVDSLKSRPAAASSNLAQRNQFEVASRKHSVEPFCLCDILCARSFVPGPLCQVLLCHPPFFFIFFLLQSFFFFQKFFFFENILWEQKKKTRKGTWHKRTRHKRTWHKGPGTKDLAQKGRGTKVPGTKDLKAPWCENCLIASFRTLSSLIQFRRSRDIHGTKLMVVKFDSVRMPTMT
jgi:hypothetical protein